MPNDRRDLAERWERTCREFVKSANQWIESAVEIGEDLAGDGPEDPRGCLEAMVWAAFLESHRQESPTDFRQQFPPNERRLPRPLQRRVPPVKRVVWLSDHEVAVQSQDSSGNHWWKVDGTAARSLPSEILSIGFCAATSVAAVMTAANILIQAGVEGETIDQFAIPTSSEQIKRILPFPDGPRVLVVTSKRALVVSHDSTTELVSGPDDVHASISPDGRFVAVGAAGTKHRILAGDTYAPIAQTGPLQMNPVSACFNNAGTSLAMHSIDSTCSDSGIGTLNVAALPRIDLEGIWNGRRIQAIAGRAEEFILGREDGHVCALGFHGEYRWRSYFGEEIVDMDVSPDGQQLAIGTRDWVSLLEMDTGTRDPYFIGNSTHRERFRWIFCEGESAPLRW